MDHKRRKKRMRASQIVKIVVAVLLIGGIIAGVTIFLKNTVKNKYASTSDSDIKSATVESNSISTTVYGSGRLNDADTKTQEIPDGVKITEVKVETGDTVAEGQEIASVNLSSVMTAMSETQSSIESLDKQLKDAAEDEIDDVITSKVAGRVKKIYAAKGDDVSTVMASDNALMLISMDGYMAVDVSAKSLKTGDKVTVITSKNNEYSGKVEKISGDKATVILTDNGPKYNDLVTVKSKDGTEIGTGKLYIHDPLSVVGYAGTIKSVSVSVNEKISAGKKLFKLKNTSYTANYEALLNEREEKEETLLTLVEIYRKGAVTAEYEGTIRSVPPTEDEETTDDTSNEFTICPDKTMTVSVSIDEQDILSLSVGQKVDVEVTSVSDETVEGTITEIDKTGTSDSGVTTYTATVQIDKTEGMLAGMSASASITIESVDNALIIPVDALKQTSSTAYVYTSYDTENGKLDGMTEVEVGISNSSYVEIKSGLKEGDVVYYQEKTKNIFSNFPGGDFGGGSFPGNGGGSFPGGDFPGGNSGSGSFPGNGGSFPGNGGSFPGGSGNGSSKSRSGSKRGDS